MKKSLFLTFVFIGATALIAPNDASASNGILKSNVKVDNFNIFSCGSCGTYCGGQTIGAVVCLDGMSSADASRMACDLLMAVHLSGQCDS